MVVTTNSAGQTRTLAKNLAQKLPLGKIFALFGPLGAGKTTFIQGFAQGLGIKERLLSPTFVLIRQYDIPNKPQTRLIHLDLYRLEEIKQIEELGIREIFNNPQNIVLIEWADRLGKLLPQNAVSIRFQRVSENTREISITALPLPN